MPKQPPLQVKQPIQFLTSNGKTYIPIPIDAPCQLKDSLHERVLRICGEGNLYRDETPADDDEKYRRSYLLLLLHGDWGNNTIGDWIIDYTLDWYDGVTINSVSAAAQIK